MISPALRATSPTNSNFYRKGLVTPGSRATSPSNSNFNMTGYMKQSDKRSRNSFKSKTTNFGTNSNFLTQKAKDNILDFYLE